MCTLGEALSAVVLSGAVPRAIDAFVWTVAQPNRERYPSVPGRLVSLIWEDLREGFALEQLLRHPEARRAGDRTALLRHINALVRAENFGESSAFSTRIARISRSRARPGKRCDPRTEGIRACSLRARSAGRSARGRTAGGIFVSDHFSRGKSRRDQRRRRRAAADAFAASALRTRIYRDNGTTARNRRTAHEPRQANVSGDAAVRNHRKRQNARVHRGDRASAGRRRACDRPRSRNLPNAADGAPI